MSLKVLQVWPFLMAVFCFMNMLGTKSAKISFDWPASSVLSKAAGTSLVKIVAPKSKQISAKWQNYYRPIKIFGGFA